MPKLFDEQHPSYPKASKMFNCDNCGQNGVRWTFRARTDHEYLGEDASEYTNPYILCDNCGSKYMQWFIHEYKEKNNPNNKETYNE